MAEVERITVSVSKEERELIEKLGDYFEKTRDDFDNNLSNIVRWCVRTTANLVLKQIEEERYGRKTGA